MKLNNKFYLVKIISTKRCERFEGLSYIINVDQPRSFGLQVLLTIEDHHPSGLLSRESQHLRLNQNSFFFISIEGVKAFIKCIRYFCVKKED